MNKLLVALFAAAIAVPAMAADEPEAAPSQTESVRMATTETPSASTDEEKSAPAPKSATSESAAE